MRAVAVALAITVLATQMAVMPMRRLEADPGQLLRLEILAAMVFQLSQPEAVGLALHRATAAEEAAAEAVLKEEVAPGFMSLVVNAAATQVTEEATAFQV